MMQIIQTARMISMLFIVLISLRCGDQQQRVAEADFDAINALWQQYQTTINTGDLDGWVALWDDNAVQMAPDSPPVIGKELIRTKYQNLFSQYTFEINITNEEGGIDGNMAFTRTSYTTSVSPKSGGQTFLIKGKALTIFKKQADDTWKISYDCFNDSAPVVVQ